MVLHLMPRFKFDFSLAAVYMGGCPHNAVKGSDVFSDKEAVKPMNPGYLRVKQWDDVGCCLFMCLANAKA